MNSLTQQIFEYASKAPEGTPVTAKSLLHLGARAAVDQALARLVQRRQLIRAGRGVYVKPSESRFGTRPPSTATLVRGFREQQGEIVAASGAAEANALGLTTQVPVREMFLTSGPTRHLVLGGRSVEFRHAPAWQLVLPERPAGAAIRAIAWAGKERAPGVVAALRRKLSAGSVQELAAVRPRLPTWVAREVSALVAHG
jgi:hypothetical protein